MYLFKRNRNNLTPHQLIVCTCFWDSGRVIFIAYLFLMYFSSRYCNIIEYNIVWIFFIIKARNVIGYILRPGNPAQHPSLAVIRLFIKTPCISAALLTEVLIYIFSPFLQHFKVHDFHFKRKQCCCFVQ